MLRCPVFRESQQSESHSGERAVVSDGLINQQAKDKQMKSSTASTPPYTPARVHGEVIWTSGQLPVKEDGHVPDLFEEQCEVALDNLERTVREAGGDLSTVVKVNVYIADIENIPSLNAVYSRYFPAHAFPARTTVEVAGFRGKTMVEIDAVAHVASAPPVPRNRAGVGAGE
jgi:2-iminobutanoate/2-iminopropanoate deaminase